MAGEGNVTLSVSDHVNGRLISGIEAVKTASVELISAFYTITAEVLLKVVTLCSKIGNLSSGLTVLKTSPADYHTWVESAAQIPSGVVRFWEKYRSS